VRVYLAYTPRRVYIAGKMASVQSSVQPFTKELEPTLRRLPGLETGARDGAAGSATAGLQARADILLALDTGMAVVDVSVTHPGGVAVRAAAAATDGAAAFMST
jgi:hypothetical protein